MEGKQKVHFAGDGEAACRQKRTIGVNGEPNKGLYRINHHVFLLPRTKRQIESEVTRIVCFATEKIRQSKIQKLHAA